MKMEEKKIEGRLGELVTQVRELESKKSCDRRKKEYKDADKEIIELKKLGSSIIVHDAIITMEGLGYHFELQGQYGVMKLPDGFTVYIVPNFYVWSSSTNIYFALDDTMHRQYSSSWIHSSDLNFMSKVKEVIEKEHQNYIEKTRVGNVNESNAKSFMQKLGEDWTSRSGDWNCVQDKRPWAGNKVEMEYEEKGERSSIMNDTRVEVEFYREKYVTHFDFRAEFKTEEEAFAFWKMAKELVETTTNYVKKERRE
jgi:hypothetical protein